MAEDTEQVEQVDTDGEAGEVGYEDEPTVASGLVSMVFPLEHQPEDNCREEAAVGIYLAFHCAEPEGVAEGIDQCAGQCAGFHRDELCQVLHLSVHADQFSCQMAYAPEEEHDAGCAEEGAHHVDHQCDFRGVAYELCEQIGSEHEEGCPRGVTDFELIGCCDELGAVPETCCWFHRAAVDECGNGERKPPHQVVDKSEMLHFARLYK